MEEGEESFIQEEVSSNDEYKYKHPYFQDQAKGKNKYVQCDFLKQYIIENNDDDRVVDMFALVVYGTIIFPQSPEYVDAAIVDLIEQMDYPVNLVPAIVAETIRSLNYCTRENEWSFIGCAQLLYIWVRNHFWGKCEAPLKFCMSNVYQLRVL